jgi:aminoglycoside phosphotransferase (APT) family kinase protein
MWRRRPVVPCSAADIERRAAAFLAGRRVSDVRLLESGRCNSNYRFRAGDGDLVIRLHARGDPAAPRRERAAMALVSALVPVPGVLASGDGWAIGRFLPGTPLDRAITPGAVTAAARTLAAVASVRFATAGDFDDDGRVVPWDFGGDGDAGDDFTAMCLARPRLREALGDLVERVRDVLAREKLLFDEMAADPRLVHGDFRPDNILVEGDRVTGLLDWEFSHAGSPYMDLGNLMRHLGSVHAASVERGLRDGGFDVPADWMRRAALTDLSAQLEFVASDDVRDEAFRRACVERIRGTVSGDLSATR